MTVPGPFWIGVETISLALDRWPGRCGAVGTRPSESSVFWAQKGAP